jgi:hypothetical protein
MIVRGYLEVFAKERSGQPATMPCRSCRASFGCARFGGREGPRQGGRTGGMAAGMAEGMVAGMAAGVAAGMAEGVAGGMVEGVGEGSRWCGLCQSRSRCLAGKRALNYREF